MDPRLIPPGTLPPPNGVGAPAVQQRPNISYFLFLSLMFYLLNYNNNSSPTAYALQPPASGNASTTPYTRARYRLLLREARYEGLSRWLGASNSSEIDPQGWLNSTYFPNATSNATTALKVTRFELENPQEAPILVDDLTRGLFNSGSDSVSLRSNRVYPQNLTGFIKGGWNARPYTFPQLGLNETWQEETRRRIRPNATDSALRNATSPGDTNSTVLEIRAVPSIPPLVALNSSASSNATYETITTTYNRTRLRGPFPFTFQPQSRPNKALFNLREVQTSATGPIVPLSADVLEQDDSKLLRLREGRDDWQAWEKKGIVTYLGGELTLSVEEGSAAGEQTSLDVEAAHLLSSGLLYGYATPGFVRSQLVEIVSLPFFANSSATTRSAYDEANVTAQAIGRCMLKEVHRRLKNDFERLEETLAEQEREGSDATPEVADNQDTDQVPAPQCMFRFYGALRPLPPAYTPSLYSEFYASLFRPTGSSLPPPPNQILDYVLSSTNCGIVLEGHGTFLPTPLLWTRTKDFALLVGLAQLVIVVLLVRHLEKTSTRPGTIVNVASASIGIGCIVDAYVFVLLLTAGVVTATSRSSLPLFIPSFLALLSSLLFGMRYVSNIRAAVPPPSRPRPAPVPAAPSPVVSTREELAAHAAEARARGDTAESPVETANGAPARVNPASSDSGDSWTTIPTSEKIILGLMLFALVTSITIIWRYGWIALIITIVYSYWIPQIILNVQRGTSRQSLTDEFIIGNTVARLVLPVYFYGYSDNVLDVEVSPWIYVLIMYSVSQAAVLVLQSRPSFGARFFFPQRALDLLSLPPVSTWDYHQPLSPAKLFDIEASLKEAGDSDFVLEDGSGPDCSICMETIALKPTKLEIEAMGSVAANERVRSLYALTPCGHLLHSECLQSWMNVRSICSVCRTPLPALS
ncbi:ubiquitin-protein ligase TUL1 [Sporobolomyces koalae]|uniref:ubiquitin-protein ligase TUL1 n=1 Tax=Sporobolomyces koalae TaxID=500713 RepID=UPI0031812634